jgi:2-methylisocitrate lyase-like PEP mutase family enzyme
MTRRTWPLSSARSSQLPALTESTSRMASTRPSYWSGRSARSGAAEDAGSDLFINARIDVYLHGLVAADRALQETLERAARYEAAGCDGIFVPLLSDSSAIGRIVHATELPVNVLAVPDLPAPDELRRIGVRRLSVGSAIASRSYDTARRLAMAILKDGSIAELYASKSMTSSEMNGLLRSRGRE